MPQQNDPSADVSDVSLDKRIKRIHNWETLSDSELYAAVEHQLLAEVVIPSPTDVAAVARKQKEDAAGVAYDQRCVLLSVNATPQQTAVSCVVREAVVIDGQVKERNILKTLAIADVHGKLSPAEAEFVTAIQDAIAKFVEA